jgi:hypothetical protein
MSSRLARAAATFVAGAVVASLAAVAPAHASDPVPRHRGNPTGTAAGSLGNGSGNLKVSLDLTPDGQVKVSWTRPAPATALKKFVVKVGPNRLLDNLVKSFKVARTKQSLIVPQAFGVLPDSGNFTFVKVVVYRRTGQVGASPTKWIEAPIVSTCTAAPDDQVTVGTFNIRNWQAEARKGNHTYPWEVRGGNVIKQIIDSGARAVAIQEASGPENIGYGPIEQDEWLIQQLNAQDPAGPVWADALTDDYYKNPGSTPGLKGTRVFYDTRQFSVLDRGLYRLMVPGLKSDSLMPWALLQSTSQQSAPFVLTSNHLFQGEDKQAWDFRTQQVAQMVADVQDLWNRFQSQVIVAGDLNETANSNPYNQVQLRLLQMGMFDASATTNIVNAEFSTTNGLEFPVRPTPNRRDYLLTYGSVKGSCQYTNLAYRDATSVASDHFMQKATLPLPAFP